MYFVKPAHLDALQAIRSRGISVRLEGGATAQGYLFAPGFARKDESSVVLVMLTGDDGIVCRGWRVAITRGAGRRISSLTRPALRQAEQYAKTI